MKSYACFVFLLCLFLVTTMCLAESINLDDLTLQELLSLEIRVSMRIHEEQIKTGKVFAQGAYTVGKDFPEGFARVSVIARSQQDLSTIVMIGGAPSGTVTHIVAVSKLYEDNFLFWFKEGQTVTILGDDIVVAPYL